MQFCRCALAKSHPPRGRHRAQSLSLPLSGAEQRQDLDGATPDGTHRGRRVTSGQKPTMLRHDCYENVKSPPVYGNQGLPREFRDRPAGCSAILLYRGMFKFGLVYGNALESCFDGIGEFIGREATQMTEHSTRTPIAKSWADDIDDLYYDAMEKSLQTLFYARARRLPLDAENASEQSPGTGAVQRGPSAGGIAR